MKDIAPFEFKRTKGIVWVCDLAKSSSYLNNNETVEDIESFIPRFYYISKIVVESFGGKYLKWTGDGFLAFFEFELDRNKQEIAKDVFNAAWHLTFMSNVTQLGLQPSRKFRIRHGITYEKDALLMNISPDKDLESWDIIGRSVVLAFRLSGIQAEFPSIVTVKELISPSTINFCKWKPTAEDKLKFFKGERFGLESVCVSTKKTSKLKINSINKKAKKLIYDIESPIALPTNKKVEKLLEKMNNGPDWCKEILESELKYIKEGLLGTIKELVAHFNSNKNGL
jgi:class 3 adenylate cyclase